MFDEAFAEFARRTDLPQFDIIGLHGIWIWISTENRQVIVDLINRRLKVGRLVCISYNCFPGWAPAEPLRHLVTPHSDLAGSEAAGTVGKVDGALKFAKSIADSGALYFKLNPAVTERLKRITEQNRNYLAHMSAEEVEAAGLLRRRELLEDEAGTAGTQRWPSSERPPPGTTQWTCGWCVSAEPQVWSTVVRPMRAPRCLGSAVMVSRISAAVLKRMA